MLQENGFAYCLHRFIVRIVLLSINISCIFAQISRLLGGQAEYAPGLTKMGAERDERYTQGPKTCFGTTMELLNEYVRQLREGVPTGGIDLVSCLASARILDETGHPGLYSSPFLYMLHLLFAPCTNDQAQVSPAYRQACDELARAINKFCGTRVRGQFLFFF